MTITPKPAWIKARLPSGPAYERMSGLLERRGLHTVCDSAHCPNRGECWTAGTATFMILGGTCTRGCRFCAVPASRRGDEVRPEEASELAEAIVELDLSYAVITSVDRDDLEDRGAAHFARCVRAIKNLRPDTKVEVLAPDYREGEIELVLNSGPEVFAHNIETVERLQAIRDPRAGYAKSLHTLELAAVRPSVVVKSSILLGLGESEPEVLAAMDDLRSVGCASLVMGQYLRPSSREIEVVEFVHPDRFARYAEEALARGFTGVVSSPLARTSYHANQTFGAAH
jgi:lipoyl synthase